MSARSLASLTLAALAALALAACGGGGHSSTTSSVVPSGGTGASSSSKGVPLTIKVQIPKASQMAKSRRPLYVSASTSNMVVTTLPSGTSATGSCPTNCPGGNTIAVTVLAPPTDTQISVVLSDSSLQTLSQIQNFTISPPLTAGAANTINLTFDGVVNIFQVAPVSQTYSPLTSGSTPITLTPYDIDGNEIVGPGNLEDAQGNVIVNTSGPSIAFNLTIFDTSNSVTASALTWNAGNYTLSSTVSYNGLGQVTMPNGVAADFYGSVSGLNLGGFNVYIPAGITLVDAFNGTGGYQFLMSGSGSGTWDGAQWTNGNPTYALEIPQSSAALTVQLTTTFNGASVTPTADTCSGNEVATESWATSTGGPSTLLTNVGATGTCQITLTDSAGDVATINLALNNPQVIISGKNRKK